MVEGYISKKVIRYWLENYESLVAGDRPFDEVPGNSGPKADDGVTASFLNKVMLNKAIDSLPDEIKACCKARWVYRVERSEALAALKLSRGTYDYNCSMAVELIFRELNGEMIGVKQLLQKLKQ